MKPRLIKLLVVPRGDSFSPWYLSIRVREVSTIIPSAITRWISSKPDFVAVGDDAIFEIPDGFGLSKNQVKFFIHSRYIPVCSDMNVKNS
jgi:hypothetical protein